MLGGFEGEPQEVLEPTLAGLERASVELGAAVFAVLVAEETRRNTQALRFRSTTERFRSTPTSIGEEVEPACNSSTISHRSSSDPRIYPLRRTSIPAIRRIQGIKIATGTQLTRNSSTPKSTHHKRQRGWLHDRQNRLFVGDSWAYTEMSEFSAHRLCNLFFKGEAY